MTDEWHYTWYENEIEDKAGNPNDLEYKKELLCFLSSIDDKLSRLLEHMGVKEDS